MSGVWKRPLTRVYSYNLDKGNSFNISTVQWCELQDPGFFSPPLNDQRFLHSYKRLFAYFFRIVYSRKQFFRECTYLVLTVLPGF